MSWGKTVRDRLFKGPVAARSGDGLPGLGTLYPGGAEQFKPNMCSGKPHGHTGMFVHEHVQVPCLVWSSP